jgi:uncharacterized membrane protein
MTESQLSGLAPVDLIAPFWFFACWAGYGLCADRLHGRHSLMRSMEAYRRLWMRHMLQRDNRIVDSQIIDNLVRSSSFFASTALESSAACSRRSAARTRRSISSTSCRSRR